MAKEPANRMMVFMSKRMIACDKASYLISLREESKLDFLKWWQLKMHLLTCHLCRKYARQLGEMRLTMEQYREECSKKSCSHHLSREAGARIGKELDQELHIK